MGRPVFAVKSSNFSLKIKLAKNQSLQKVNETAPTSIVLGGGFNYDSGERLETLIKPESVSWTELPGKIHLDWNRKLDDSV